MVSDREDLAADILLANAGEKTVQQIADDLMAASRAFAAGTPAVAGPAEDELQALGTKLTGAETLTAAAQRPQLVKQVDHVVLRDSEFNGGTIEIRWAKSVTISNCTGTAKVIVGGGEWNKWPATDVVHSGPITSDIEWVAQ